jgi:FKBP-type peptidyl-prolyl cis-trans isomerase FkpA
MRTTKNLLVFLLAVSFLAGCGKVTYRKTAGGMPYQLFNGTDTQKIYPGNIVKVFLTYKVKDSVYYSSFGKVPDYQPINTTPQPYDISEIWTKLKKGDSVVVTQMMDTFIKRSPLNIPPQFKKGDRIVTIIKVVDVFTSDSLASLDRDKTEKVWFDKEDDLLGKYIADKKIAAQKTPSGAYVQIINPGTGNLIDSGNYVSVNYTGVSFSGKKFDSNTDTAFHHVNPYSFVVNGGQMIRGFDEAMRFMKPGGSAKVYIPSRLGYGGRPNPQSGIKPYENLLFDIAIVEVKEKAPEEKKELEPNRQIKVDTTQHIK